VTLLVALPPAWAASPFAGDAAGTAAVPAKRGGFAPPSGATLFVPPPTSPDGETRAPGTSAATPAAPLGRDTRVPGATDALPGPSPFAGPATRAPGAVRPIQPPSLMAPRVLGMYPNEYAQGTGYSVTLSGENLNPTLKVDFGAGILVKGAPSPLYGGKLKVAIDVLPFAAPGKRKLGLGSGFGAAVEQQAEFQVVQQAPKAAPKKVNLIKLPETNLDKIFKGKIILDVPAWRQQVASQAAPKGPDGKPLAPPIPIWKDLHPTLDDSLLFVWHEQNKGLAERFEIRFYLNDKLLAKRGMVASSGSGWGSIPHYRPDAALIGELFQGLKPKPASGKPGGKQVYQSGGQAKLDLGAVGEAGVSSTLAAAGALSNTDGDLVQAKAKADITWEVAGFRQYAKSGVAKSALADLPDGPPIRLAAGFAPKSSSVTDASQTQGTYSQYAKPELVDIEVEISERWPLYLPDAPTGLGCPSAVSAGLSVNNIDSSTQNGKLAGASGFTYDHFQIKGQLNLSDSPYTAHVGKTQASTPNTQTSLPTWLGGGGSMGSPSQVLFTTWSFDNVFVDWGDGTQEPLAATMTGDAGDYARGDGVNLNNSLVKYVHSYASPGQYIVRLFQLGEDDIQGGGQQVAALSADMGNVQLSIGGIYNAALNLGAGGSQAQAAQAEVAYGKVVADRAYMVFCQPLTIQRRADPAANGPLKLVDISVEGVATGGETPKAGNTKAGKSKAKSKAQSAQGGAGATATGAVSLVTNDPASLVLDQVQTNFNALALLGGVPAYSTCDYQLTPYGLLHYTGQGEVRTRWYVDGMALPPDAPRPVGPSQARPDSMLKNPPNTWGPPLVSGINLPAQSPVGLEKLGMHELRVEAEALPDSVFLFGMVEAALGGDSGAQVTLAKAAKEGVLPKLGVLAAPKVPVQGGPGGKSGGKPGPVLKLMFNQWFNDAAPLKLAAAGKNYGPASEKTVSDLPKVEITPLAKKPPVWAVSEPQPYLVVGQDPAQACTFDFPVAGPGGPGKFRVVGLQTPGGKPKVTRQGDRYSGQGDLLVPIPGGGMQKATVNISNWKVAEDGITVQEGQFSITATGLPELLMPALKGRFTRLDGVAGKQVDAWLDAQLSNAALPEAASASQAPRWKGVKAGLSPEGDWYADGLAMSEFLVYDSGFRMQPQTVAIDLSAKQGSSPGGQCAGGGNGWRGVALGKSDLLFFNFDMPGAAPKTTVSDWGIDADGLCGKANSGAASHDWLRGKIGWNGIEAKAWNGIFKATYDDLWVYVPWLNTKLTGAGDPVLLAGKGQGQGGISLVLKGQPKALTHGPITLKVSNLAFTKTPLGAGANPPSLPAASADACFDFQGESQVFAKDVCVSGLHFALDGQAYFAGATSKTVSLSGKSGKLAQGTVTLKELKVGTSGSGDQRLRFDFLTDLKISQALPAATAPVSYQITEPATSQYTGSGPITGSFEVKFDSPLVKAAIKPVYAGPKDGTSVAANPVMLALADMGYASDAPLMVALGSGDTIIFKGEVDLTQFQAPVPLKGHFLLGYHGDTDFWATKFTWSLPSGVVLVPGVLSLYEFGGGLGYHVTRDSLVGGSLDFVEFSSASTPVLNAMALVGTVDTGFIFAARGDLNIKPSGGDAGVDMVYSAWLLSNNHSGKGPIAGTLGYGGGAFTGTMGGKWGPPGLDNHIYMQANPTAIGFSVGGGDWYFKAGSKADPITGYFFVANGKAWFDLNSSGGLHIGAKANARFPDIQCDGGTCAYVEGEVSVDSGVQLKPIQIDAKGNSQVTAKGCLAGACASLGESVSVHAAAPNPLKLGFGYSLSACPIGKLNVSLTVLPSVDPGISADLCSLGEMGAAIASGVSDAWDAATGAGEGLVDAVTSCFGLC
jgi:hypothetical protein